MGNKMKKICSDCIHCALCTEGFDLDGLEEIFDRCSYFEEKRQYVKLPVKVGQTLYVLDEDKTILGLQIHSIDLSIGVDGIYDSDLELWDEESGNGYEYYDLDDIGKTLFLTREEAESKLNEREGTTS